MTFLTHKSPKDDILHRTEKENTTEHSNKNHIIIEPNRTSEKGK